MDANPYVWGIDPSSRRVAIGFDGPEPGAVVREFESGPRYAEQLASIRSAAVGLVSEWAERRPPQYVVVETPAIYGDRLEPQFYFACGVIQEAVYAALSDRFPFPVYVDTIAVSSWKLKSVGKGNATKPMVLQWARRRGYEPLSCPAPRCLTGCRRCQGTGCDLDASDAFAISYAGRRLLDESRNVQEPLALPI